MTDNSKEIGKCVYSDSIILRCPLIKTAYSIEKKDSNLSERFSPVPC